MPNHRVSYCDTHYINSLLGPRGVATKFQLAGIVACNFAIGRMKAVSSRRWPPVGAFQPAFRPEVLRGSYLLVAD